MALNVDSEVFIPKSNDGHDTRSSLPALPTTADYADVSACLSADVGPSDQPPIQSSDTINDNESFFQQ